MDLALNNLQRLICHKIQQTKPNHYILDWLPNQGQRTQLTLIIIHGLDRGRRVEESVPV